MEKVIACCGLNCATCDARVATIQNDNELRKATAEKWKTMFNASGLSADAINCTGCREPGVKFSHCNECQIRNCVKSKGYDTCGDCSDMETCEIVSGVHKFAPDAITNLRNLN